MSFTDDANERTSKFKRVELFDFTPGEHVIRILDEKAFAVLVHWMNNASFQCLGTNCPVCAKNADLQEKHGRDSREIVNYPKKSYLTNVFDMTQVKVCPECSFEIKPNMIKFPPTCSNCDALINKVEPVTLNKIKVFRGGARVFRQQLDEIYNEYGDLRGYNLQVLVSGSGRDRQVLIKPLIKENEPLTIPPEDFFDLSTVTLKLTSEEIVEFTEKNVSIKSIFEKRRANTDKVSESLEDKISTLFSE